MPEKISQAIEKAIESRWWGTISIQFQDGEPVILRQEQTTLLKSERRMKNHVEYNR